MRKHTPDWNPYKAVTPWMELKVALSSVHAKANDKLKVAYVKLSFH